MVTYSAVIDGNGIYTYEAANDYQAIKTAVQAAEKRNPWRNGLETTAVHLAIRRKGATVFDSDLLYEPPQPPCSADEHVWAPAHIGSETEYICMNGCGWTKTVAYKPIPYSDHESYAEAAKHVKYSRKNAIYTSATQIGR